MGKELSFVAHYGIELRNVALHGLAWWPCMVALHGGLVWLCMVLCGLLWYFVAMSYCGIISPFLAVIDSNSFGLVSYKVGSR